MSAQMLLLELFTEELPPKALRSLGESFSSGLEAGLRKRGVLSADTVVESFASPRRLAVRLSEVLPRGADVQKREKLLPVSVGLNATGEPQPPLIKKLASLGITLGTDLLLSEIRREMDGKAEALFVDLTIPGLEIAAAAQQALDEAIAGLPIPKVMRYQRPHLDDPRIIDEVKFVRPAHRLIALYGADVLPLRALGLTANRETLGHRFLSTGVLEIPSAQAYTEVLRHQGQVVASYAERQAAIAEGLSAHAEGSQVVMPQSLLDEVTALVEWPVILAAGFEEEFLQVPQECLILTMQQNQKYFALTDGEGRLVNRFLLVSNLASKDPSQIVAGNERVLRARLSDAKFFYDQDRKQPLESRIDRLESVVYQQQLGSQRARIDRLVRFADWLAPQVGADPAATRRAALLAKADLVTDMVGEFPELQGIIGRAYAAHDGEPPEVAEAIEHHYRPRFSGDVLPDHPVGLAVALADRLETLVGIWAVGLIPTGDKDPFALRRAALGVARMLIERALPLQLSELLQEAANGFAGISGLQHDMPALQAFVLDRTRGLLRERGHEQSSVEAVLAVAPNRLDQAPARLSALRQFLARPEAEALCAANKRITNILKKADALTLAEAPQTALYAEEAERALGAALAQVEPKSRQLGQSGQYEASLDALATLKQPVDSFFDEVMVNADDPQVRQNRLALLASAHRALNQVADLGCLA